MGYKLTVAGVRGLRDPGKYGDGNGLSLQVSKAGQRSWIYRFMIKGQPREMGLGSVADVTLAEAREKAAAARRLARSGIDPIEHRKNMERSAPGSSATVAEAARLYIEAHEGGWRNKVHRIQWKQTIRDYVLPVIGDRLISSIETTDVLAVLQPIWTDKVETASRLRGRLEVILDFAAVHGWRDRGSNPAVWKGNLSMMLPRPSRIRTTVHHAALDWRQAGGTLPGLLARDGTAARALALTVLVATRTSETLLATWPEFDLQNAIWTIPAARMKKGRQDHRIPLSAPALAILREMLPLRDISPFVFPGRDPKKPLSNMAMSMCLERMGSGEITTHGFRSTFRDWAAETTNYPNHVVEMALSHTIGDKVEAAYRRGDLFERRRQLMNDWAAYLMERPRVRLKVVSGG